MIFFVSLLTVSCTSGPDNYELLEGEWTNISLNLEQRSLNNSSIDSVLQVKEGQWDSLLQMKPIRTTYNANGTFISRYYNLSDSLLFETEGQWYFVGDSLYLATDEGVTGYYFTRLPNNRASFEAIVDWDNDGRRDDLYKGVQQKN